MLRAASNKRRGRCVLPGLLAAALLLCGCLPLLAQGQYDAARDAMAPAPGAAAVPPNRLLAPEPPGQRAGRSAKARVHELVVAAAGAPSAGAPAQPVPAPAAGGPPSPGTAPAPPPAGGPQAPGGPATGEGPPAGAPPAGGPRPPAAPPGEGPAPSQPAASLENPDEVRLQGDTLTYRDQVTTVRGRVELRYHDLTIRSQAAELDRDRVWGTFHGAVSLEAKLYKALGQELRVNLDTEEFQARGAAAEVAPEFFGQFVTEPLYLRADEVSGDPSRVVGDHGLGTSCDHWPGPHWMLRSDRIVYRPGDDVSFAKPTLYMFGHRLFRYPWDLHLSLRRRENRFLPEVGQNEVEGYYAKFAYGYALNEANSGFLRLNLTQKRGTGYGFDHSLALDNQQGEFSVFFEPEEGSFSGRLDHRAQLSRTFNTNLSLNFQQDTGYSSTSDSLNGDLTFRYDAGRSSTQLGFQESIIGSDYSTSRRFASNLNYRERLGTDGDWSLRSTYRRSAYSTSDEDPDEELETELNWRQQFSAFSLDLQAQKRYDLDASRYTGDDSYYTINRIPDLTLRSESARLGNLRLLGSAFESTLYLGWYQQMPEDVDLGRAGIDLRLPGHVQELGGRASLRTSGRFQQMFYSDGSARWIGQLESEYYRKLSRSWESRLNFSYTRPNGYSPLRLDYSSPASTLYWQAVRLVPERMRLDFSFGRDFHNNSYQDAILRSEIMLSKRNRLEAQTGYSLDLDEWRPLNLRWVYATAETWWSAVTVNYSLDDTELTNISFDVDWNPSPKWRVQFIGGYSGALDQADFKIIRDLHCMQASLTYIDSTKEIRFGLGIKAFPSDTRAFGVSGRGQQFESNFGDQY